MSKYFRKSKRTHQYLVTAAGFCGAVTIGMGFGWPSPMIPRFLKKNSEIPMTNEESSWIVISALFGSLLGSNIGGQLLNRIGRKYTVLFTAIPLLISWTMIAFTRMLSLLICARIIGGISDGCLYATLPLYVAEISDPASRGVLSTSILVAGAVGMLLMNIFGSYLSYVGCSLIPLAGPLLLLSILSWMPESPYYLISKGKMDEARLSLQTFKGTDDVDSDLKRLTETIQIQNCNKWGCLSLFRVASNRRTLLILLGLFFCQQCTGANAIMFYAQTIFQRAGSAVSPTTGSIIYFTIQIIMVLISAAIVDRIGRKPLLITSISGTFVALLINGIYFSFSSDDKSTDWIPIFALTIFIIAYNLGLQSIPVILASELFPMDVKAVAMNFATMFFSMSTMIASKFFQLSKDYVGIHLPFLCFAVCCVFGLLHIIFFIPETKGKTLEDIQMELNSSSSKKHRTDNCAFGETIKLSTIAA